MRRSDTLQTGAITFQWDGAAGVLLPSGELDLATAPALRAQIGVFFEEHPGQQLVLDLSDVTFVDSTVLGVLVRAVRIAEQAGSSLAVRNPAAAIRRVFELTGLNRMLASVD